MGTPPLGWFCWCMYSDCSLGPAAHARRTEVFPSARDGKPGLLVLEESRKCDTLQPSVCKRQIRPRRLGAGISSSSDIVLQILWPSLLSLAVSPLPRCRCPVFSVPNAHVPGQTLAAKRGSSLQTSRDMAPTLNRGPADVHLYRGSTKRSVFSTQSTPRGTRQAVRWVVVVVIRKKCLKGTGFPAGRYRGAVVRSVHPTVGV